MRRILIASVVALALFSCGKKERADADAARLDAPSPLAETFRLKDAKAADVDALFALLPPEMRPSYEKATFDKSLGAMVLTNLSFPDPNPFDEKRRGAIAERAEIYGLDAASLGRVKSASERDDKAPFLPVFRKMRLYGVKTQSSEDGANATIAAMEFDSLSLRESGLPKAREEQSAARFVNAVELAGLYFKDYAVAAAPKEGGQFAVKAPDLRFVGIGGGKVEGALANDLEYRIEQPAAVREAMAQAAGPAGAMLTGPLGRFFAPEEQRVRVKTFEWRNIDMSGLLEWGLRGEEPPITARNLIDLGTMAARDIDTFVAEKRATHSDAFEARSLKFTWLVPSDIRAASKGDRYDFTAYLPDTEKEAISVLKGHGLDKVTGTSELSWRWDTAKGAAALNMNYDTTGLADFLLTLDLAGLVLDKIDAASRAGDKDAAARLAALKRFRLKIADEKLLDAVYAVAALEMGGTGADLRQSTPAMLRLSAAGIATQSPRLADYIEAVAAFLSSGGTLDVVAAPKTPVTMEELSTASATSPDAALDLMGLTVTHTD